MKLNEYSAVFGRETLILNSINSTQARKKAARKMGIASSYEWRIKITQINQRVPLYFKTKVTGAKNDKENP